MAFGNNPTTTGQGSLATNQFPISSVAVPNATSGNLNALQGGPAAAADVNGNVLAPVSIYVYDGNDVTQGTSTDAANANSIIGQLKQIKTNTGSVTIGTALPAGTNVIGHVIVDSAGSVSITSLPSLPSGTNVIGHVIVDSASSVSVTTLPGVGTDGSAIPSMSMLMGASDGTLLQQLLVESATNHNLRIGIYSGANEATVTGANALKVDNSAVTQPVSGVFWQSTQPVSAASLPLPTGAATSAKQPVLGTAGTASTDVLSVQGIASMTPLKTDGSGVTQPVSGTVTANAGSGTMTVGQTTGTNLHTVVDSGSITATTNADTTIGGTVAPSKELLIAGKTNDGTPQYQPLPEGAGGRSVIVEGIAGGTAVPVSGTFWQATQPVSGTVSVNALPAGSNLIGSIELVDSAGSNKATISAGGAVKVDNSAVTQPVSGTVTSNIGTTNGLALDTSVSGMLVSQASTTSGEKGPLVQGAVTTAAPTYTTAQTNPLSLDTSGLLRTSLKDTPSNTNNLNVNLAASAATVTVSATNLQTNINQVAGSSVAAAATGIMKVGVTDGSGTAITSTSSALDVNIKSGGGSGFSVADEAAWTAGTSAFVPAGGVFNDSATALTSGQEGAVRLTSNRAAHANLRDASGNQLLGSKTSANSVPVVIASDQGAVTVSGTVTANAGTNLNTSTLALESGGNLATLAGAVSASKMQDNLAQVGGATITLGSKVSASSLPVVIASDQAAIAVQHGNAVDAVNSSTATLTANSVFTGTGTSSLNYSAISIEVFADQASAANGLSIQQSQDNSHWDIADTFSVSASTVFNTVINLVGQYYRVVYTNGGTNQGALRLQTVKMVADAVLPRTLTAAGNLKVDGSSVTQPVSGTVAATQSGTWTVQPGNTANTTAWKVDGSAVTQPVSGTFWQATQPVSGTVTANVGTTNGLALDTSVNGVLVAQGSTTSGEKGPLVQGAVTSGAPSYTTAQTSPISLTTAGALRTDASATTQPVSGTVSITANSSVNVAQVAGTTTDTNSGNKSAGTQRVVLATDQPQLTNALKVDGSAVTQPISAAALPLPTGASTSAKQPALGTAGSASTDVLSVQGIASMTPLKVDGSGVTQPVSGTVTANAGTNLNTSTLALESGGNLATIATRTPALGQAVKASSSPVVIASDQGDLLVKGDFTEQASLSAAALNADLVASTDVSSYAWISLHITTIATGGTISFQASNDNFATQIENVNLARVSSTTTISSSTTNTGIYEGPINFRYFRARQTAWTSGSSTGVLELYTVPRVLNIVPSASTQAGTWTIQPGNTANTTPWLATINQGGNSAAVTTLSALKVDNSAVTQPVSGTVATTRQTSSTAALSVIGANTTSTAILPANTVRRGMTLYNDSSSAMYLAYAQSASTTVYTTKIPAASYYEMPTVPVYLGPLSAVWDTATGNARITELLA